MSNPSRETVLADHHPRCVLRSFADLARERGEELPDDFDREFAEQAGLMECHEDCPRMAQAVAYGRKLRAEGKW